MQNTATRSATMAKTLALTIGGLAIGFYFFKTINTTIIGGLIGFVVSFVWQ